jgi:hypothetical protein
MMFGLFFAAANQAAEAAPPTIPHEFRGTWARSKAGCDNTSSADWVAFDKTSTANSISRGVLKHARLMKAHGFSVSYSLSFLMAEEGRSWPNDFILSWRPQDPDKLVWTQPKRPHLWHGSFTLIRCTDAGPEA